MKKTCNITKEITNFGKAKGNKDGYRNFCKPCGRDMNNKYYKENRASEILRSRKYENKETLRENARDYYHKNRTERIEYSKNFRNDNKEYFKSYNEKYREENSEYFKNYNKEYYYLNKEELNSKSKNYKKNNRESINNRKRYTQEKLKQRIELNFKEGMSWDNHGEWHIDHIKPIDAFCEKTDPSIINALCNLQPLWANENLKKSNNFNGNTQ